MSFECACGKKFTKQQALSRHGVGGNGRKSCPLYLERKGRGERVNVANTTNTINGNNNIQGNNNNVNHITQNIQINAFGKEDISMLTDELLKRLAEAPKSCIQNTYEKIIEKPENRNVRDTDPSRKLLRVYDGDDWKRMNRSTILNKIVQNAINIIREHLDAHGGINKYHRDELYNRVYKSMSTDLLRMERNKISGLIIQNS